jgi:hypothetical protein
MENCIHPFSIHNFVIKLNWTTLFKFECRNSHVIFLTGKNIKLSQFIHNKNKSQQPLIHTHRESIITYAREL